MPYASDIQRRYMWAKGLAGGETLAKGIPDRSDMGDASRLPVDSPMSVVLQKHLADKAGLHYDFRLGTPETGLQSWALPKGLPAPGEKRLAVPQPLHSYDYKDFEGEIPEGYGKGTVENVINGNALVTKNTPDQLNVSLIDFQRPERYSLINTKSGNALALNTTPQSADPAIYNKQHYKTVTPDKVKALLDMGYGLSPKYDGASEVVEVHPDKLEVTSIRPAADGKPIVHTERIGGLTGLTNPSDLVGTRLKAELIGERNGRAIPLQELSGMLNSKIIKAIRDKAMTNTQLRLKTFDQLDGDPAYRNRVNAIKDIIARINNPALQAAPVYYRSQAAKVFNDIKSGKYPLTNEGVVLTDPDKPNAVPIKAPNLTPGDVLIKDIVPANTVTGNPRAGAIRYALPDAPDKIVGNVGSGFDHKFAEELLANKDSYIGRLARILSKGQYGSGAYRAPVFQTIHEG